MELVLCRTTPETARHNSQAFSMDPSRLHLSGASGAGEAVQTFSETDNYIKISNVCAYMSIEENNGGKYHTLNSKIWKLAVTDTKTDDRGRIHLNREFVGRIPSVYVSEENEEPETCKHYIILSKSNWLEVRRVRGKEAGGPLEIQTNGDIWTGHKNKFVKVFIKEVKKE